MAIQLTSLQELRELVQKSQFVDYFKGFTKYANCRSEALFQSMVDEIADEFVEYFKFVSKDKPLLFVTDGDPHYSGRQPTVPDEVTTGMSKDDFTQLNNVWNEKVSYTWVLMAVIRKLSGTYRINLFTICNDDPENWGLSGFPYEEDELTGVTYYHMTDRTFWNILELDSFPRLKSYKGKTFYEIKGMLLQFILTQEGASQSTEETRPIVPKVRVWCAGGGAIPFHELLATIYSDFEIQAILNSEASIKSETSLETSPKTVNDFRACFKMTPEQCTNIVWYLTKNEKGQRRLIITETQTEIGTNISQCYEESLLKKPLEKL